MSTVPAPKVRPAAAVTSSLVALALVGVAVVSVHDLSVARGWSAGSSWTGAVADRLDGQTAGGATTALGIALVVVGLWWVVLALKPAPRSHHATQLDTDVWISSAALASAATQAAEDVPGVAQAATRVRRRRVAVTVQTDRPDIAPAVESRVREHLAGLSDRPVKVTTEKVKHDA